MKPPATSDALLEIGMEELPARFATPALAQLKERFEQELTKANLPFVSVETWGTPRRLAAFITGMAAKAKDRIDEAVGPPPKAAKDEQGKWTAAALGFAKSQKIAPEKLVVKQTPKGERLVAFHPVKGQKAEVILKDLFPSVIASLTFPKSMVWEPSQFRFARPLRRIVALFNSKIIRFKIAGVASDRSSLGLMALGSQKITIPKSDRYKLILKNRCILVDPAERRIKIQHDVEALAKRVKCRVVADDDHLNDVVNLTAYPVGILGQFDETYLSLPREVLTVVLRKHQKFFPLETAKGPLSNYFIGVRNGPSDHQDDVRDGYERVVHARFADAKFFFEHDSTVPLEVLAPRLSGVGFHEKLGTLWDKTERVRALTRQFGTLIGIAGETLANAERTALLAKADLLTQIVGEFPELQGVAGRFYTQGKEKSPVSAAIEQHYWPLTSDSPLPSLDEAALVSVADKMDTLAADFSVGLVPSGSADPYGLRRFAIGVIRILMERKWAVSLNALVELAFERLPGDAQKKQASAKELKDFLFARCANWFKDQGCRADEIDAVFSNDGQSLAVAAEKLAGLKMVRGRPEFVSLASAIKRARNILTQANERGALPAPQALAPSELGGEIEKSLLLALEDVRPRFASAMEQNNFGEAFLALAVLKNPVDAFFTGVMVMVDDAALRSQRLQLLMLVRDLFDSLADFSKLQSGGA